MSQSTIARRYATALYEEADDSGVLETVDDDVLMLRESLESNEELSRFFQSPVIPQEKKDAIIQSLLGDRVAELVVRFLRFLVQKDRETMTRAILDAYQSLRDEQLGIIDVHVAVAQPLADDDRKAVVDALETKTGKTIRLHENVKPELIGGIVIRIGDSVFDGSVRNKLNNLHDRLRESSLSFDENGQAA